jgi:hypothetical protein
LLPKNGFISLTLQKHLIKTLFKLQHIIDSRDVFY